MEVFIALLVALFITITLITCLFLFRGKFKPFRKMKTEDDFNNCYDIQKYRKHKK